MIYTGYYPEAGSSSADIDQCYNTLVYAVVEQAIRDYQDAYMKDKRKTLIEIRKFFRSDWYKNLCQIDPEWIIGRLDERCVLFRDKSIETFKELRAEFKGETIKKHHNFKCPFCGDDDVYALVLATPNGFARVKCMSCGIVNRVGIKRFMNNDFEVIPDEHN